MTCDDDMKQAAIDVARSATAKIVLEAVQKCLAECQASPGTRLERPLGATVLLHLAELEGADPEVMLVSTLSNRSESRIVMAEALVRSVTADGGTPDSVAQICELDAAIVFGGRRSLS